MNIQNGAISNQQSSSIHQAVYSTLNPRHPKVNYPRLHTATKRPARGNFWHRHRCQPCHQCPNPRLPMPSQSNAHKHPQRRPSEARPQRKSLCAGETVGKRARHAGTTKTFARYMYSQANDVVLNVLVQESSFPLPLGPMQMTNLNINLMFSQRIFFSSQSSIESELH